MKRVKNLFRMAMVALAAIAFAACDEATKPQEEQKPQVNENLTLAVDVEDITFIARCAPLFGNNRISSG